MSDVLGGYVFYYREGCQELQKVFHSSLFL